MGNPTSICETDHRRSGCETRSRASSTTRVFRLRMISPSIFTFEKLEKVLIWQAQSWCFVKRRLGRNMVYLSSDQVGATDGTRGIEVAQHRCR